MPFKDFIDWLNRLTDYRQRMADEQAKQKQGHIDTFLAQ
jgi:hypothetical protein